MTARCLHFASPSWTATWAAAARSPTGLAPPKNGSSFGDEGTFQMIGGPDCGITDPAVHWMQTLTLAPANFLGDMGQGFACLAGGLGQSGCGYQQPLQALAVSATIASPAYLPAFLREDAFLGIILRRHG
jgi:hypothetical protein